jgi:hypothetical protein
MGTRGDPDDSEALLHDVRAVRARRKALVNQQLDDDVARGRLAE